ncbi:MULTISPECIES: AbrB/MazE/SpoVT family DNA-binding domain-containing protein [Enterobacteriaceae]|jgi:antitoxin ChpS|uniref:AbrB/MazE/SpoVT family DNA-binding domain-containing protein n=1 Tax=Citrobacter bitternis TaxID=1585982 RepID=A0ABW1PX29_9ENTR|nr:MULTISPECIES: antitoxin [Enterobacteriaceae]MBS6738476.1 antitoxin [Enterobacteriaceae bacterium]PTA92194.1 antitoxin [Kluyvera sp. Nf5]SLJ90375.1 antitoxin ChpS [Enterobacter sp. NFR05]MBY6256839.1 antitoxin [Phytobacter diazotrophicus]QJF17119.1 antitoxin [Phytobacter diazotrophicus]
MYIARLKKVGGSVMLAVPPAVLKTLGLSTDSEVGMTIENGCLIIEPQKRPHYSLEELLAQCDPHAEISEEDRQWIDAPAAGKELL